MHHELQMRPFGATESAAWLTELFTVIRERIPPDPEWSAGRRLSRNGVLGSEVWIGSRF